MSAVGRVTAGAVGAIVFAVVAAGCGGSKSSAPPPATGGVAGTTTAMISPAAQEAQVKQVWTSFFSSSTPASQKPQLLQNGQRFSGAIQALATSPLAKQTGATVSSVKVHGSTAAVVYSISVAGKTALTNQHGTAVLVGRAWKVGDKSFCQLVGLQGTVPAVCKSVSG